MLFGESTMHKLRKFRNKEVFRAKSNSRWLRRIYLAGVRRTTTLLETYAYRFGILNSDVHLKKAILPNVSFEQVKKWGEEGKFFIDATHKDRTLAVFTQMTPDAATQIIRAADHTCEHIFDLLSSGPTRLGKKIDWHSDFKSAYRWNPKTYYKRIRPAPYPGGYEIKMPWELSRCQHFTWLGQAYWLTGDEKYAHEFVTQIEDWITSNPWPWGVNWACTMDVAIRVVNWLWGYHFFKESPSLSDEFHQKLWESFLVHGRHIWHNLENQGSFTGNHYLSNLVGLVYLGILCPIFKEAQQWREFGLKELEQEMFKQVYPDGVDFEASTSYHRLVLEIFLSATLLAQRNNHHFSPAYIQRLEKMFEFIMYLTKPDGSVPLIGDNDNGRLHRLKVWEQPEQEWIDFRYLLAIGAVVFRRDDFAQAAGEQWDETIWMLGAKALTAKQAKQVRRLKSRAFPDAGLYIMRHDDMHLVINAGPVGQNGSGGHAHNDALSFEFFSDGITWIMDPGTYSYTNDYSTRNLFRSTAYHNLVTIDNQEQNPIHPKRLFQMPSESKPLVHSWHDQTDYVFFNGSFELSVEDTYICHNRKIFFHKQNNVCLIQDHIQGNGCHHLKWYCHVSPNNQISKKNDIVLTNQLHKVALLIKSLDNYSISNYIERSWVASGYGKRQKSATLISSLETNLPFTRTWAIMPWSKHPQDSVYRGKETLRHFKTIKDTPKLIGPNKFLID